MRWLIVALIVLALAVVWLFQRNAELERANRPRIRPIVTSQV